MRLVNVRGMKPGTQTKTKTMKNMMKYAVVACVAFFALNSQSEAASLHVNLGKKEKACCVHQPRHHVKKHDEKHCCHEAKKLDKHRRKAMARHRKECCLHGR